MRCGYGNGHSGPLDFKNAGWRLTFEATLWIEVKGKWMQFGVKSPQRQLSNPVWPCGGQQGSARPVVCHFQGRWAHWSPGSCWSGLVSVWQVIKRAEDWALVALAALPCRITELDPHPHWPCSMCVSCHYVLSPRSYIKPKQKECTAKKKMCF